MAFTKTTNAAPAGLLSREAIERCMQPGASSVIATDEPHGYLISVVVGAGIYRPRTVAGLFRIQGDGDRIDPSPRRVEMVQTLLNSLSEDLLQMAHTVFNAAKELSNCTIVVDQGGLGTHFIKILEILGAERVIGSTWGRAPEGLEHQSRFFNRRAQCNIHAAEAVKDGRITLVAGADLVEQGSTLPYHFDEYGRYHMRSKEEMHTLKMPTCDAWDVVAMAFLESASCVPAQ